MSTNSTVAISDNPATLELCAILRNLCNLRVRLERFHQSEQGYLLREFNPEKFADIDGDLCEAAANLSDCVGAYFVDEYLSEYGHE